MPGTHQQFETDAAASHAAPRPQVGRETAAGDLGSRCKKKEGKEKGGRKSKKNRNATNTR